MSSSKQVLKNTGYLYLRILISFAVSLLTTRLLLNSLGVSDYGIYNVVGGSIAMLGFLNSSMAGATQRFMSYAEGEGNKSKKRKIFNVGIVLHISIAIFVGLLLLIAAFFFFNGILNIEPERLTAAKVVYGSLIVSTILTVTNVPYDAVMNAHENMLFFSVIGVLESVLKLLIAVACVYTLFDKLILYGILMACVPAITLSAMKYYCHRKYEECVVNPARYWDSTIFKEMTKFAGWNFFSAFTSLISGHGSNLLLNHFFGTALNAANGVCGQLNAYMQTFSSTLIKAVNPVIVKSEGGHQRKTMFKFVFTGAKLSVFLYSFFAIPIIINRDYVLEIWLKNVPPYTSNFVCFILIWSFISQIGGTLTTSINAIGRIKEVRLINGVLNLATIIFVYISFKEGFPPQSMILIGCIISAFQLIIHIFYNKAYGNMSIKRYVSDVFIRVLLTIIVSYSVTFYVWQQIDEPFLRFVASIVVSSAIFIVMLYWIGLVSNERKIINELTAAILRYGK